LSIFNQIDCTCKRRWQLYYWYSRLNILNDAISHLNKEISSIHAYWIHKIVKTKVIFFPITLFKFSYDYDECFILLTRKNNILDIINLTWPTTEEEEDDDDEEKKINDFRRPLLFFRNRHENQISLPSCLLLPAGDTVEKVQLIGPISIQLWFLFSSWIDSIKILLSLWINTNYPRNTAVTFILTKSTCTCCSSR
jgi:hypothetical protein